MAAPQKLPYARAEVLQAFRRFADKGAPTGCISPEALEKALVSCGLFRHPCDCSINTHAENASALPCKASKAARRVNACLPSSRPASHDHDIEALVCTLSLPRFVQLTYGQDSGIEPLEVSRFVHSLDTTNEGFINFREQVVLLFSGRRESAAGTGMV